ncbi:pro-sigmaK processing inhibitor BofA family protein [Candidatus Micrarchaeota archaeon]|nr:pro-sigmaK processing inhibitor BofA family protein [Candidatus Micrarchaeota archaeon]
MASAGLLVVAVLAILVLMALGGSTIASAGLLVSLLINSLLGVLVLALLHILGLHVPINLLTVLVVVLFGLAGVVLLALLAFFDIYGDRTITRTHYGRHGV